MYVFVGVYFVYPFVSLGVPVEECTWGSYLDFAGFSLNVIKFAGRKSQAVMGWAGDIIFFIVLRYI
jgi:hypothetical protein